MRRAEPGGAPTRPALTPWGRALAASGAGLLALGLALGNFPWLVLGVFSLAIAVLSKTRETPRVTLARGGVPASVHVGEGVQVEVVGETASAVATIHDRLPDAVLLHDGTNFDILTPDAPAALAYEFRAARRGVHPVGPASLVFPDPLSAASARAFEAAPPEALTIRARPLAVPRLKAPRTYGASFLPGGDLASRGVRTNEFRELRPYAPGDPLKMVNWKATARASSREMTLVVNETEAEGKKAVWLFVDVGEHTARGTTFRTGLDEVAEAALTVASHFVGRGHRVGLTLYGPAEPRIVHPEAGEAQRHRIEGILATVEPATEARGLEEAVLATRGFLARERPLVFVVAILGEDLTIEPGLLSARALAGTGRRPGRVVLLAPDLAPATATPGARLVRVRSAAQLAGLERKGILAMRWEAGKTPLPALLARGILR